MSTVAQADPAKSAGSAHPLAHRRPLGDIGFLLSDQGQALLKPLFLAPLPPSIDQSAVAQLSKITS